MLLFLVALIVSAVFHSATPIWSYLTTDAPQVVGIFDDTIIVGFYGLYHNGHTDVRTEGIDASTGRRLWRRKDTIPTFGGAPILAVKSAVERIDFRTGKASWRSAKLCKTPNVTPTNAIVSHDRVYVACNDGEIFALQFSNGRLVASADPIHVARIVSIIPLASDRLTVTGYEDISMGNVSAILDGKTFSPVLAASADSSYLAFNGDEVIAADTCCRGEHEDNWPATIRRFSLLSGKQISSSDLHPYQPSLPNDKSQPGGGTLLLNGTRLFVSTHSALFQYDIRKLSARPRTLFDNIAGPATIVENRYMVLIDKAIGARRVRIFDARSKPARVVWSDDSENWSHQDWNPEMGAVLGLSTQSERRAAIVRLSDMTLWQTDGSCWLVQASTQHLVLTYCPGSGRPIPAPPSRFQMYRLQN
jgi:hypothetical protein